MKSHIPALDLSKQHATIQTEITEAITRVIQNSSFVLGNEVTSFQNEFAKYCHTKFAFGVASGTDALQLALLACNIGSGDEVITSAHTAVATVTAIEAVGARPVLVDIDGERFTLDPKLIRQSISPKTRAIIPVHLYGCPVELDSIMNLGSDKINIVEDCAQAHGAKYQEKSVGSWGNVSAFSFYPTKNIGAIGDGGAVCTNSPNLGEKIQLLRQYGWKERYISSIKGINSRLDEIQAAVLRVKLPYLDHWNKRRREIATMYNEALANIEELTLPIEPPNCHHVYHQYVIRTKQRDELKKYLKEHGIDTLIHYPVPIHLQPAYRDLGYQPGDFPHAEKAAQEILSLPIFPELDNASVQTVCKTIKMFFKK